MTYQEKRDKIMREFTDAAIKERADFDHNPSKYDLTQAIGIVGIDRALELFYRGVLKDYE
jgi:hypothetical protein